MLAKYRPKAGGALLHERIRDMIPKKCFVLPSFEASRRVSLLNKFNNDSKKSENVHRSLPREGMESI